MELAISTASRNSFVPYRVGIGISSAAFRCCSVIPFVMGVVVLPGATPLIRRPSTAQLGDTRRIQRARAHLEELYAAGPFCKGAYQVCQVAGVYEGAVSGADRGFPVLLPESVLRSIRGEKLAYIRAHFSLDPAKNREMAGFRTVLEEIVSAPGAGLTPLRAVLLDEELRQAVEPLEDSIALMKLLYPVVVVLSVLVAAGVSVLFVMLSAKGTVSVSSRTIDKISKNSCR